MFFSKIRLDSSDRLLHNIKYLRTDRPNDNGKLR